MPMDLQRLTAEQRHHLHARWAGRTRSEWASARTLHAFADQLTGRLPQASVAALHRAADDEARHGRLCAKVTATLGEVPAQDGPLPGLPPAQLPAPELHAVEHVIFLLVAGEAIAAGLLRRLSERCDPELSGVLQTIAHDEYRHAQLGWSILDALVAQLTPEQVALLRADVPRVVGTTARTFMGQLQSPWPKLAAQWGLSDEKLTTQVTRSVIQHQLGPSLHERGLWLRPTPRPTVL